ncbi:MBL fold metallo-hydrolase [Marinobacterium mangrovicola]|uniref:Glyoxylase-like metal-dependent hydrolase (Beta-lactamase superfamily II) n=1 Tax=Marinobacterium mangrovicola TaxID=1476959 RepID=A0A4V2PEI7_9GAMM|nr:MBL fold metallo-hydrolase [Marinobacterium mangrovicola]TCK09206.1 glyoxylase-like metal-dependent hydrolase (beta-lactamase superfamily II) [Marinobacterium mangrovicola]
MKFTLTSNPLFKTAATLMMTGAVLASATAGAAERLELDVYNAGPGSFHVNATLVTGETEALLIDTGFTKADALRIAAKVLDAGKPLKTIFISQADPDFYFGAEVLKQQFPEARIITTAAVAEAIEKKMQGKVGYWGPKLGANAPVSPVLPEVYEGDTLTLDGHVIEIRGTEGILAHRPYLWIPGNQAILGDLAVFSNLHLWTADTQTDAELDAWTAQLESMLALNPETVIPGHMAAGSDLTAGSIEYSKEYLANFRRAVAESETSEQVKDAMTGQYPEAGLGIALDIGAKVHTGEMQW